MSKYWNKRQTQQREKIYKREVAEIEKHLTKMYKRVSAELKIDITDLFLSIVNDEGETRINDLYRFGRLYELCTIINEKLEKLGAEQVYSLNNGIKNLYKQTSALTLDSVQYNFVNAPQVNKVIDAM